VKAAGKTNIYFEMSPDKPSKRKLSPTKWDISKFSTVSHSFIIRTTKRANGNAQPM
jgi:hypothetical protein